ASTTFFRQVGATLGSAVVGAMFSARLASLLTERLPGGLGNGDGAASLTPELVASLPAALHDPVVQSYNDALIPLFLVMVPLALVAAVALAFVEEKPLATVLEEELARTTA